MHSYFLGLLQNVGAGGLVRPAVQQASGVRRYSSAATHAYTAQCYDQQRCANTILRKCGSSAVYPLALLRRV